MPSREDLQDVDIVVFDIQDVGARFFTYIITLQRVMQACADFHKPILLLDRPNPNGYYVDGPVLEDSLRSGVGLQPIPIVHGMTMGELAKMINGEGWLSGKMKCQFAGHYHDELHACLRVCITRTTVSESEYAAGNSIVSKYLSF